MSAVTLTGVRFAYGDRGFVLDVPSWHVPAGARVGVVGPSGCGKSTLLGLLSGSLVPQAGTVQVGDTRLDALGEDARRAWRVQHVGFVFQDYPLVDYLDALDNVLLPYRLHPALVLRAGVRTRALALLAELGLANKARRRPATLSQGERQRVAIARALVTEPLLVLADEPTTGLDVANADAVMDLLEATTRARGTTLVMVTHDTRLRPRFEDVLVLGEGP